MAPKALCVLNCVVLCVGLVKITFFHMLLKTGCISIEKISFAPKNSFPYGLLNASVFNITYCLLESRAHAKKPCMLALLFYSKLHTQLKCMTSFSFVHDCSMIEKIFCQKCAPQECQDNLQNDNISTIDKSPVPPPCMCLQRICCSYAYMM